MNPSEPRLLRVEAVADLPVLWATFRRLGLPAAFSPDGRALASCGDDCTIVVWDVTGRAAGPPPAARLSPRELGPLWASLAGGDAAQARRAVWSLAAAPEQAVPFLREHLRPAPPPDRRRLAKLVADLDADRFEVRERATAELGALGDGAEPALREALAGRPPPEVSRRLEQVLARARGSAPPPESLRALRGVEVLEQAGTPEARRLLESLARGDPQARLTREAKACLERLARQAAARGRSAGP
jgi:hypothetical protein